MTLSQGRHYLAIPGPSVMPDEVLQAMHRPAPNIYEGDLVETTHTIAQDLKWVARTVGHVAMYISNGHGAWEASLANMAQPGEKVLVVANGRFGQGWGEMAREMGIETEVLDFGMSAPADPARIEEALRADTERRIKAVLACHVDTSSSVRNDVPALRAAIDAAGHPALLAIDCIASLACDRYEMDAWGADVTLAASQKGLMTPPGMAFIWFNDRAAGARTRPLSRYWDWAPRANPEYYYQHFGGTAPTHHLFGLRAALDMLKSEGLEQVWTRHETLASAYWAAIETWSQGGPMRINVSERAARSRAITSVHLPDGQGERLRLWCSENLGVTLGIGLGREPREDWFRIGHMGHVNAHMVMGVVGVLEAGLRALGIPHGEGAGDAAAQALAEPAQALSRAAE
ncbi:pyridoxal-phosphate-dependent aminotransferase family protein [Histidinibacterium aquaticum]|uniref:Alanine--glyoxylate aminotransferase family protein n=1 Tax=Histidinibacterium aquaticum TaxID=2613962 RepID=A0A5J5GPF5_9RHOB|nr:aminotransferase class V-fold PLP-dependent enzyme [Histidinibacterium aquaticum]KAA9010219.1 alanine--glyoxylate aminotransferase family protein [Histidinibacterium aquaticum]